MQNRLDCFVVFLHYIFVLEFPLDFGQALDVGVQYLAVLFAVAFWNGVDPLEAVELEEEVEDKQWMRHVDECKPHALLVLQVHRQVKVIVVSFELFVDQIKHVSLVQLDWNILNHQSRQAHDFIVVVFLSSQDSKQVNEITLRPFVDFLDDWLGNAARTLLTLIALTVGHIQVEIYCQLVPAAEGLTDVVLLSQQLSLKHLLDLLVEQHLLVLKV